MENHSQYAELCKPVSVDTSKTHFCTQGTGIIVENGAEIFKSQMIGDFAVRQCPLEIPEVLAAMFHVHG